jgi:hypothetical protein
MTTKYFVIDPAGVKHARTTKSRAYTHAVLARPSYEQTLAGVQDRNHPETIRTDKSNYQFNLALVDGTSRWLIKPDWQKDEAAHAADCARKVADAKERLEGCLSFEDYRAKLLQEAINHVEKAHSEGYYDKWQCKGWSGRPDLAAKLAASYNKPGSRYAEIIIVEAQQ